MAILKFKHYYTSPSTSTEKIKFKSYSLSAPIVGYAITYSTFYGDVPMPSIVTALSDSVLPVLEDSNHLFLGWYYDQLCTMPASSGDSISSQTVLYGKWQPTQSYTESISGNTIHTHTAKDSIDILLGTTKIASTTKERTTLKTKDKLVDKTLTFDDFVLNKINHIFAQDLLVDRLNILETPIIYNKGTRVFVLDKNTVAPVDYIIVYDNNVITSYLYSIKTTLTNVIADRSNVRYAPSKGSVELTFTAIEGYSLPNNISVIGATYTWDKSTGKLILSNANNLVTISITGEKV